MPRDLATGPHPGRGPRRGSPVAAGPHVGVGWTGEIEHPTVVRLRPRGYRRVIGPAGRTEFPAAVIAAGTERGNEVMAHLAALLDLPLAANVTVVRAARTRELTRVRWGAASSRRHSHRLRQARHGRTPFGRASDALRRRRCRTFMPDLTEADHTRVTERVTLVGRNHPHHGSGGRQWWPRRGSPEGFAVLEELAGLIGGAVGCSRVVTNSGWRPHSDQVGQTGTRVAPNLYIACGISGAIQHWVGMMASKNVLAINTDPEAPMVTKADYAVIGDLHPILPAIVEEIKRRSTLGMAPGFVGWRL